MSKLLGPRDGCSQWLLARQTSLLVSMLKLRSIFHNTGKKKHSALICRPFLWLNATISNSKCYSLDTLTFLARWWERFSSLYRVGYYHRSIALENVYLPWIEYKEEIDSSIVTTTRYGEAMLKLTKHTRCVFDEDHFDEKSSFEHHPVSVNLFFIAMTDVFKLL